MTICFLRHGEADWPNWSKPDDERPLTERGRREMKRVAKLLERLEFSSDVIFTSPLPRAAQTAEIAAKRLRLKPQVAAVLAHGFSLEKLRRLVGKVEAECVMVVGHEPEFSEVIRELTGGKVKLSKAGIALVETNRGCTSGKLLWLLPPKVSNV